MKKSLSPTSINMYLTCGESFRRRYILGEKIAPGLAMIKGSSVHFGAETNFKQKLETYQDLTKDDIVEVSVESLKKRIKEEGVTLSEEEKQVGKRKVISQAKDSTANLAELYSELVAPRYQPKLVEQEEIIEIPNSEFDLKGIIDLVDDKETLVDLKTTKRAKSQEDIDSELQFTFYSMLLNNKGTPPKSIVIEQLVDGKTTKNIPVKTSRDTADYQILLNKINVVVDGISKGIFPPAAPGSWKCNPRYCGYYDSCSYVRKK